MHFPQIFSTTPFNPIWSGIGDSILRPNLMVVRDGSGYRPLDSSAFNIVFSGGVSITGVVSVDAVGITGKNGVVMDVQSVSGFGAIPVFLASGSLGSSSAPVAVQATKPSLPNSFQVYAISLTGSGVFSNYASSIPNVTGNPVTFSVEPSSNNTDTVYYSFSGTASTGNAFELRGDKTFYVSATTGVFFAQSTSGGFNKVMIHIEVY